MLDKILSWIADRIGDCKVRTMTISGTTNSNGALALSGSINSSWIVDAVSITSGGVNYFGLPFKYDDRLWFAEILDWQTMSRQANKAVTAKVYYRIGGGVLLNPHFSTLSAILKEIGGGVNVGQNPDICCGQTPRFNNITCSEFYELSNQRRISSKIRKIRENSHLHRSYRNEYKLECRDNIGDRFSICLCHQYTVRNEGQQFFRFELDSISKQRWDRETSDRISNIRKPFLENIRSLYCSLILERGCASC